MIADFKVCIHARWLCTYASVAVLCFAQAQVMPPLNFCGSVNEDNAFVMNWDEPTIANPDLNYEIWRDNGTGFALLTQMGPANNTTFTDFAVNTAVVNRYFVRSIFEGETSVSTDTIANIVLSLTVINTSEAQLSWTLPFSTMPAGGSFNVYREPEGELGQVVATLGPLTTSYNDTLFGYCEDTMVSYSVAFEWAGCIIRSQLVEDEFTDIMPPPQPVIETASVDPLTDDIVLTWAPVMAEDLAFYRVQDIDVIAQQFINVGFIPAGDPTEFVYENAGGNGAKTLAVISFDECGNDASFDGTATTMFAEASYTECSLDAMVSWSEYEGWDEGVAQYRIQAYVDGAGPVLMGETDGSSTFFLADVEPNREYCFFVEAVSLGTQVNATSNGSCVVTDYPNIASIVYLSSVDVIDASTIEVNILQDVNAVGTTYRLSRARQTGNYVEIAIFNQTADQFLTYTDKGLDARSVQYNYRFEAYDGCGTLIGQSNLGTNIVLDALAETRELKNYLSWNPYEAWQQGVSEYQIWRKVGSETDFQLYATVGGDTFIFEDDVEQYRDQEGEFCYRVVAIEAANSYGLPSQSRSYTDCVTQPPIMWIPSAIVLDGQPQNQVFKPVAGFIDLATFRMEIYNKWGQLIFESADIDEGWDGTYRGNRVREDVFRYIIAYSDGSGKPYIEQDVLYVLRK